MDEDVVAKTITDIEGVYASGLHCGIKPRKKDLAYIYIPTACASAAVFTRNKFVAPCLTYTRKMLSKNTVKAIIINSGNANALTGDEGYKNAKQTAKWAASYLNLKQSEIAVASTGIIGVQLPMEKIESGLARLLETPFKQEGHIAAEAILTTDTFTKEVYFEEKIGKKTIVVAGITKGSGMIAPNMGTTLTYLVTNARIETDELKKFLVDAIDDSFNMTTVDSDTSTNDMAMIFSTGERKFQLTSKEERDLFKALLLKACIELAKMVARDGEGAFRLLEVVVKKAANIGEAKQIALDIANSPLVKTAIHGADPNWGRVVAAAGKNPKNKLNPEKVDVFFGNIQVMAAGAVIPFEREDVITYLKQDFVQVTVDLNLGTSAATAWGCDLSKGYIDINTRYT